MSRSTILLLTDESTDGPAGFFTAVIWINGPPLTCSVALPMNIKVVPSAPDVIVVEELLILMVPLQSSRCRLTCHLTTGCP